MGLGKFNLSGKTAVITGASGLLGHQHSAALLECGARVVLTDIDLLNLSSTEQALSQEYEEADIVTI